jgi:uncharacterized UPF0160 family protein
MNPILTTTPLSDFKSKGVLGPTLDVECASIIITHDGIFHADDVFAVTTIFLWLLHTNYDVGYYWTLGQLSTSIPPDMDVKILRTRDQAVLDWAIEDSAIFLVDVGDVYDPHRGAFDHHQRERKPHPRDNGVPYSSFGLVWKTYGLELVQCALSERFNVPAHSYTRGQVEEIHADIDRRLIEGIDATDCGMVEASPRLRNSADTPIRLTGISGVISSFNPLTTIEEATLEKFDQHFVKAMDFASRFLFAEIGRSAERIILAKEVVLNGYDANNRLIILDKFVPWHEHAVSLCPEALYCIFPTVTGSVNVQQIPEDSGGLISKSGRKSLPEKWRGLRGEELAKITGVKDAIFCHINGFICGAASWQGAKALAKKAVEA